MDLRGLDPPQPLLHILEVLEGPGAGPHAFLLEREPVPLYGMLAAMGWRHRLRWLEDGVEVRLYRKTADP